jgi:large subunit ribosomal protein L47
MVLECASTDFDCLARLTCSKAQHGIAMAATTPRRFLRPALSPRPDTVLAFLVPSAKCTRNAPAAGFSTSPARCKKDNNINRGLSAVRATGLRPRQTLSVMEKNFNKQRLPKPVKINEKEKVVGTDTHGLWGFFKDKKLLQTPVEEQRHGTQRW